MRIRFNLITLNGLWTFIQYITDTQRHTIMSAAGIETPQDVYPLRGKKKIKCYFFPRPNPNTSAPISLSLDRSHFHLFMLLS